MKINVLEYLIETQKKFPEKVGFEDKNQTETFSSFNRKALSVSECIIERGVGMRVPVGVFLPKCVNALISFAGAMYSGNVYVPLDTKSPSERVRSILNNIDPVLVITDKANFKKISEIFPEEKILLIEDSVARAGKSNFEPLIDTDPAYIINTSGSTGVPKGVTICHRSIIDYIEWARECYAVSENEIMANQAPFYFDNSVLDIYLCFATGLKLIITPEEMFMFPVKLLEFYEQKSVNMFFFVPSVLVNIANLKLLESVRPKFTKILFAGEVMPTKQLNYWIAHYPDALFSNLYGPTEITVDCTYYTVDRAFRDDEPLPIGIPCRNSAVLILDDADRLVTEKDKSGELCVRGTSLALGYYNDFEKTNSVFVQNPLNTKFPEKIYRTGDIVHYNERGEIIFEGRKDFQIKHLGYRIELGEIETALGSIDELANVCVVYDTAKSEIVLFYESEKDFTPKDLIIALGKSIPKYMIPTRLVKMEKLPLNANGKIDRKLLGSTL